MPQQTPRAYAQELRALRDTLGWTQAQMAQAVGVQTESYARYERGARHVPEPVLRLAHVLCPPRGDRSRPTDNAVDQLIAQIEANGYRFLGRQYADPATVFTFFAKGDDPAQIVLVHAIYSDSAPSGVQHCALYRRVPQEDMPK